MGGKIAGPSCSPLVRRLLLSCIESPILRLLGSHYFLPAVWGNALQALAESAPLAAPRAAS